MQQRFGHWPCQLQPSTSPLHPPPFDVDVIVDAKSTALLKILLEYFYNFEGRRCRYRRRGYKFHYSKSEEREHPISWWSTSGPSSSSTSAFFFSSSSSSSTSANRFRSLTANYLSGIGHQIIFYLIQKFPVSFSIIWFDFCFDSVPASLFLCAIHFRFSYPVN